MQNFNHLWEKISGLDQENMVLATVLLRTIWIRRNDFVLNNVLKAPLIVIQLAKNDLEEYSIAMSKLLTPSSTVGTQASRDSIIWVPPITSVVKVNWDALFRG